MAGPIEFELTFFEVISFSSCDECRDSFTF